VTGPAPAPPPPTPADPATTDAVQTALGTEHAAVWCYALIAAFLTADLDRAAQQDLVAHRARRDATIRLLSDAGVTPEAAEPAYRTPAPVTDQNSAVRLAIAAESDSAAAWHSVLERCDDPGLRHTALDALVDAAVRQARWSSRLGVSQVAPPFPGQP
jgi:hypothetical protein